MNPILFKLIDLGFALALAGIERQPVVDLVRQREEEGATLDEITDELQAMRQASETQTQEKINQLPPENI
ncbi:MAG: hypothetical protein ACREUQ_00805 [Burkholderiales bacterium]